MTERPILFSGPMVRALLDGRKTQTRRVVRGVPEGFAPWGPSAGVQALRRIFSRGGKSYDDSMRHLDQRAVSIRSPYGVPGDRLWVKETFCVEEWRELFSGRPSPQVHYRAGWQGRPLAAMKVGPGGEISGPLEWCEPQKQPETKWRPSIFMPRKLSRITLEVTEVRVERVQDISAEDARAEGRSLATAAPEGFFPDTWDSINGKRPGCAWSDNPWVWVVAFRRVR